MYAFMVPLHMVSSHTYMPLKVGIYKRVCVCVYMHWINCGVCVHVG